MLTTKPMTTGSTVVRMTLFIQGEAHPISHLGRDFLILVTPLDLPPTGAELLMTVDGAEDRWQIHLPDGIRCTRRKTPITRINVLATSSESAQTLSSGAAHRDAC